ncbi:MAG: MATE family efflux transporter [Lachnoclostridium sp.]|nr:MATE family efflux transporter [Lachnoclostridium sp.]
MEKKDNEKLLELATMPVGRLLLRYSMPAIVGMVVTSLYNIIDRIFIGQGVGPEAIAGLAITFPVMNLTAAIGTLVGAGASACVSIMLGQDNHRKAEYVLGNSLTLTLVFATIYIAIFGAFIDDILIAFGASEVTLPYAHDFMFYLLPGMLMTNLSFSFNNIMRASGYPVKAMITMFIGAGCNLVLAPIFIFVLDKGIKGAAIATDISMTISMIFVMKHFFNPGSVLHFTRGTYRLRLSIIAAIASIGAAPSVVNAAACFINVIINRNLLHYGGDMAVGAAGIFTSFASLLTMVCVGLCQGMQPIVGFNYGAGNLHRLRRAYMLAAISATAITGLGQIAGMSMPQYIARAFTTDPTLIRATVESLSIAMTAFTVVGFQIVSTTFFQSIGYAGKSIFLSLSRQVLFLIPLLLTLPSHFGLRGIWMAFPASDVIATMVTAGMIIYQFRALGDTTEVRAR